MERLETEPTADGLILDQSGLILHYRSGGHGDRLGPLEKRLLPLLLKGPLHAAEISRRLGVWHNHIHVAMRKLAMKGLVESWRTFGENLAGTRILRRFYALNPAKVLLAVPVTRPTDEDIQAAKVRAQVDTIQREKEGLRRQREFSPNPLTRLKAQLAEGRGERGSSAQNAEGQAF